MNLKLQWISILLMLVIPYLTLGIAGWLYLFEHGYFLLWLVSTVAVTLIAWPVLRWLQRRSTRPLDEGVIEVEPSSHWSPRGHAAWNAVEAVAARAATRDISLDRPEPMWELLREVFETVAREFHKGSSQAMLEVPVPHMLLLVELVARDLRRAFSENVPASHILTIGDLRRMQRLATFAPTLYRFYRIAMVAVNPASALARELNIYLQGQMVNASAAETKRWAIQFILKKAGYYAIELYSGQLMLRDVEFTPYTSPSARNAMATQERRDALLQEEPLRILIIGQVKSGKSSLVNALFGETRAAVDVVPRTRHVEPYLLERDGMQRAIILDTAGYEDASRAAEAVAEVRLEVLRCDLILMTCAANAAARDADRQLLDELRKVIQADPDREFPPLVVALTQIDRLRPFREWEPPYDIAQPSNTKAEQIREALEATATDLAVDPAQVIPVCLLPSRLYNVEEGLIPAILNSMGSAQRLKCLRCLREHKDEEYWNRLRQQAGNTGRILMKAGFSALGKAGRKLDDMSRRFGRPKP